MNNEQVKWLAELVQLMEKMPVGMYVGTSAPIYISTVDNGSIDSVMVYMIGSKK